MLESQLTLLNTARRVRPRVVPRPVPLPVPKRALESRLLRRPAR